MTSIDSLDTIFKKAVVRHCEFSKFEICIIRPSLLSHFCVIVNFFQKIWHSLSSYGHHDVLRYDVRPIKRSEFWSQDVRYCPNLLMAYEISSKSDYISLQFGERLSRWWLSAIL